MQLVVLGNHLLSQFTLEAAQHKGCKQAPHAFDQLLLDLRIIASTRKQVLCKTTEAHQSA